VNTARAIFLGISDWLEVLLSTRNNLDEFWPAFTWLGHELDREQI